MDDVKRIIFLFIFFGLLGGAVSYGQDCSIDSKGNDIVPKGKCAPVDLTWDVVYRGVSSSAKTVEFEFDWDDGNPPVRIAASKVSPGEWTVSTAHTYPKNGQNCNYHPNVHLVIDGTICTSSIQSQNVTVWDTDNHNGGRMVITPQQFPICYGNDGSVTFLDESHWNCTPDDENDVINNKRRWVQWIYGTGGTSILNAEVDGVPRAYPYAGSIEETPEPIEAPMSPYNKSLPIYIPLKDASGDTLQVGDFFEVTLRNWNYCNPYDTVPDDGNPPSDPVNGDFPPVITTAIAIIVALPDGSIAAVGPFCENEDAVRLSPSTPGGVWSGTGITNNFKGIFDPEIAGPGLHTINYTVSNGDGCSATGKTNIQVWETPDANIINGNTAYLCPGVIDTLDGSPVNGTTPYTHLWTGKTSPLNDVNIQTPEFSTSATGVYNLIYQVTDAHSCVDRDTIDVHVYPVDIHFNNKDLELCTNVQETLNPEPTGGSGVYTVHEWTGARTDLLSGTDIEEPTFLSPSNGLFGYKYSVTDNQGCSASDSVYVHVYDQPLADAGVNDTVCGLINRLNAAPSYGTGTWNVVSGPGHVVFNDINNPGSEVDVDAYGEYIFEWQEVNKTCSDADTVTLVFFKTPAPVAVAGGDTCGLYYSVTVTPDIGIGYWSQKSGPGTASFSNVSDTATDVSVNIAGDYVFEWTEANTFGCTGSDTVKVSFHTIPVAGIAPFDTIGCSPVVTDFQNMSKDADTYSWTFGDGSISNEKDPEHTFKNGLVHPETFAVEMIAHTVFGCSDTINKTVVVNPSPVSAFKADKGPGCSPMLINFTNMSAGADTYLWSLGDGSPDLTDVDIKHTFVNSETYVQSFPVTLVVENNYSCTDTSDMYVTVYPLNKFEITARPDTGCNPLKVNLSATPGAFTYDWKFGDGQSSPGSNDVSHVYYNTGSMPLTFKAELYTSSTFGCLDTSSVNIVVNPNPQSKFSFNPADGCAPLPVAFNNESVNADSALWKFGDGSLLSVSADSNVIHTYRNDEFSANTIKATLVVKNNFGCVDSVNNYLTVYPKVNALIDTAGSGCSPYSVSIANNSTGANEFFWDYGDGNTSTGSIGNNVYTNISDTSANYTISMVAHSVYGCSDTAYTTTEVYPQPVSKFSLTPAEGCAPLNAELINLSGNVSKSTWDFGDGSEEVFPGDSSTIHIFENTGYAIVPYRVMLKTENTFGCSDSSFNTVNVYPQVQAKLSEGDNGCSPHDVAFTNSSVNANQFFWDYGNGNTSTDYSGYNVFVNPTTKDTTFNIVLTATSAYGCEDKDTTSVTVYRVPKPDFTAVPEEQQMPNSTVTVTNFTAGNNWDYTWLWGDGNSSVGENPDPYTYGTSGYFDIKLVVEDEHCSASTIRSINIISSLPTVIYGPDTAGCPPLTVQFFNRSLNADTYMWEFGDGGVSSDKEPEYIYSHPGKYNVKLTVYGPGGIAEKEDVTVTVYESPTAYFEVVPGLVKIPGQQVSFLNRSTDAVSSFWDLGDGNTSSEFSFMYEYRKEGVFDVSLEVMNDKGCKDKFIKREAVKAEKGGRIKFPNAFTPSPTGPNGGRYVLGDKNNYVFYPFVQEGIDEYKLQIFTRWGELIFESDDIKIGWDGYYRGELVPQGVYIYKATCKFGTGILKIFTGDVTLLR
jgi:gliding motility-associated-like protein